MVSRLIAALLSLVVCESWAQGTAVSPQAEVLEQRKAFVSAEIEERFGEVERLAWLPEGESVQRSQLRSQLRDDSNAGISLLSETVTDIKLPDGAGGRVAVLAVERSLRGPIDPSRPVTRKLLVWAVKDDKGDWRFTSSGCDTKSIKHRFPALKDDDLKFADANKYSAPNKGP